MKWAYEIRKATASDEEQLLRAMGDDGWELVTMRVIVGSNANEWRTQMCFYFKRSWPMKRPPATPPEPLPPPRVLP